jgi:hypothetical protein
MISLSAYEDGTDSVPKRRYIKFRRRGNYPEESIQHSEHGKSLKSRIQNICPYLEDADVTNSVKKIKLYIG